MRAHNYTIIIITVSHGMLTADYSFRNIYYYNGWGFSAIEWGEESIPVRATLSTMTTIIL